MRFLVILLIFAVTMDDAFAGISKTPVQITSVEVKGKSIYLSASVSGATRESQVVVLVKFANVPGLSVAVNEERAPALPNVTGWTNNGSLSQWSVAFQADPRWGRLQELFVIVCFVKEYDGWGRSKDYQNFSYLPFTHAEDIDGALRILADFGWSPTGYTRFQP